MYIKITIFLSTIILFMATGCETLKKIIQTPTVQFDRVTLTEATLFQSTFDFSFIVSNPNPIGLKLEAVSYNFSMGGKTVLKGNQNQGIILPAMGKDTVLVPITVNYMESMESVVDLFGKETMEYEVFGTFRLGTFTIPYSYKDSLTLPKPPKVSLSELNLTSMSFTGARLELTVSIENDNTCALDLKTIGYSISLGGIELVTGQTETIKIAANQKQKTFKIPLELNFLSLGKSAMNVLSQRSINYEITGDMVFEIPEIGPKNFPYYKTGHIDLKK